MCLVAKGRAESQERAGIFQTQPRHLSGQLLSSCHPSQTRENIQLFWGSLVRTGESSTLASTWEMKVILACAYCMWEKNEESQIIRLLQWCSVFVNQCFTMRKKKGWIEKMGKVLGYQMNILECRKPIPMYRRISEWFWVLDVQCFWKIKLLKQWILFWDHK